MNRKYNVAVVGATGAVGETMIRILEQRDFPVNRLFPLASSRSAGSKVKFRNEQIDVLELAQFDFDQAEIGLFSAGASVSEIFAPKAAQAGCIVIDNTSQFRYQRDIPLVVPEVNAHALDGYSKHGIIANPNCSTIQLVVALKPIHDEVGIKRINICTYQAVSGTGKEAIAELSAQSRALLAEEPMTCSVYPKQIAFNVLPHIDVFLENGYTKEEMKMVWETKKILEDDDILVNPTAVRVPVYYGHSEAVHIETVKKITANETRELLSRSPGVEVMDGRCDGGYPTAATEAAGRDPVYVGRIRDDITCATGLNLWVVSDNVRKGAALNSIQIAEILVKDYMN